MNIVKFHDQELTVLDLEGQCWLNSGQIGHGLGLVDPKRAVQKIFRRHKSEFSPDMTTLIELPTATGPKLTRIFSARGAALLAMLAKTDRAAEFRGWVLDVLEARGKAAPPPTDQPLLVTVLTSHQKPCGWDLWPTVARYAAMGLTNREIATLLGRSYSYLKKIVTAMHKAGVMPNRTPNRPLLLGVVS